MVTFTQTLEDLETTADVIKTTTLTSLVREGYLTFDEAEEYSKTHTVICRKKSFFRTLSNLWHKEKEEHSKYYYIMVQIPKEVEHEKDEDDPEKEPLPEDKGKIVSLRAA